MNTVFISLLKYPSMDYRPTASLMSDGLIKALIDDEMAITDAGCVNTKLVAINVNDIERVDEVRTGTEDVFPINRIIFKNEDRKPLIVAWTFDCVMKVIQEGLNKVNERKSV